MIKYYNTFPAGVALATLDIVLEKGTTMTKLT
jgi:hypothetical protein